MRRTQPASDGLEVIERGLPAKEGQWPLEVGKGKETNVSLEPLEGMQPCQHLDF